MIELKDLDLTGITPIEELRKVEEENKEFEDAVYECICNNTEENRNHVIEEFWDKVQSSLSYMQVTLGIKAVDAERSYPKHLQKIKKRPR